MEQLGYLVTVLGQAALRIGLDPHSRMFVPYLTTAFGIAALVMVREHSKMLAPSERLISGATWLSRSAINDYGLVLLNALLVATVLAPFFPDRGVWLAALANISVVPSSGAGVALLLALTLFVADDFARYIGHWLEHRIPALWELHKVHHSAEVMNFITAERHHPLSLLYFGVLSAAVIVPVNALFLYAFPGAFSPTTLFGANVFWVVANMAGGALRHSPVWLSFGPMIERWIISPAQHQIHHSTDPRHFDRNFGGTLAIWDRMFGTLYLTGREREHIAYGLGEETVGYRSIFALYWRPVGRIFSGLFRSIRTKGLA